MAGNRSGRPEKAGARRWSWHHAGRVVVDRAGRFPRVRAARRELALVASLPPAPCLFVSTTGGGGRQTESAPAWGDCARQARARPQLIALGH